MVKRVKELSHEPDRTSQQAVIDFLESPAAHGGADGHAHRHPCRSVFLAGDRALKIKRAVRFPFLDYSTLAKRKAACEAEIEVNRAYAPAIYRGVVAITRARDGTLAIDGDGEPVEYAVDMARFDETQTLDHLAEAGQIDGALADTLGRAVAQGACGRRRRSRTPAFVDDAGRDRRAERRRIARRRRSVCARSRSTR